MKIKPGVEGMVLGCGRAFDNFEKTELEAAVHVRENLLRSFPAILHFRVTPIFKRSQFIQPVFRGEPAAQIGATFVRLQSAGHQQ